MGIKSTRRLTRKEAEELYKDFRLNATKEQLERQINIELAHLNDYDLGNTLDRITTDISSNYLVDDE